MARNIKPKRIEWGGNEVSVEKLSLGAAKPNATPGLTLFGTVANAGTGANSAAVSTGGVASKVFVAEVAGTTFYIPLFSSNA
jgi:hypothetical protein